MARKAKQRRPLGVVIICVLGSIISILFLLIGLLNQAILAYGSYKDALSSVFLLLGLTGLFAYWLLWRMKKWGLIVALILNTQFLVFSSMLFYSRDISILYVIWPVAVTAYLYAKRKIFR